LDRVFQELGSKGKIWTGFLKKVPFLAQGTVGKLTGFLKKVSLVGIESF